MIYPKPCVTADVISFSPPRHFLLIQRKHDPFKDYWALPGGFVNKGETTKQAAARELEEETGIIIHDHNLLRLFGVYDKPDRDPRHWTITVVYQRIIEHVEADIPKAGDDTKNAKWLDVKEIFPPAPVIPLAFDHYQIISNFWRKLYYEK